MSHTRQPLNPSEQARDECFRSIVAASDEGVVLLHADGVIAYTNPAAEFLLGRPADELLGEMFGIPLTAGRDVTLVNVVSADGRLRFVEFRREPSSTGPAGSQLLRLRDVTTYRQDLDQVREQVRRRDEFLAMLSHELRNPLGAVHSAGLLLARDELPEHVRQQAAEIMERQLAHLSRILDDLLDVTRISRGVLELQPGPVDLSEILRDAVEAARPFITRRGHTLHVQGPPCDTTVWGDSTRLEQVLVNLLHNAAKFTPPGGTIRLGAEQREGQVLLWVEDDGPGIPPDLLPRVFEPFVQGPQPLDRGNGGLGIGLALASSIVRLHQGSITARANGGNPGITFEVRLPLHVRAEASPRARAAVGVSGRMARILLVEDNDDARTMLRGVLELDGYHVSEAADGRAGLAALLEQQPDVAVVDLGLPELSGYDLARQARRDPRGRRTRLVALTGYATAQDIQAAREAGYEIHLVKPLRYDDLRRLLEDSLPPGASGDGRHCDPRG